MKVSKTGEQALRTLMELALTYPGKPLTLKHISDSTGTSVKFLEQIFLLLRRARFVHSQRGNHGGFSLTRDPREIYVGEVMRFIDGPLCPLGDRAELQSMMHENERYGGLYKTLLDVRDSISTILDSCTIWDLCQISEELKNSQTKMYYI